MSDIPIIFDRSKVRKHRQRAGNVEPRCDFLADEVAHRLHDRLCDLAGDFSCILNIGCTSTQMADLLISRGNVDLFVNQDLAQSMLSKALQNPVVADEEKMPFAQASFDLVVSNLTMHLVNDLPGSLVQIRQLLKTDGVFMASLFGIQTLNELRQVMAEVETKHLGGLSPRICPFTDVKTLGQLAQRTGFSQPVCDSEVIKVSHGSVVELMHDLRYMGEASPLVKSAKPLNRRLIEAMDEVYKEKYGDGEGGIISTFDVINITGLAA